MKSIPALRPRHIILFFALLLSAAFLNNFAKGAVKTIDRTRLIMGSIVEIKVPLTSDKDRQAIGIAIDKAFMEMERIENIFTIFKPASPISKINGLKANETLKVDGEALALIKRSLEYNRQTKGAFDITVGPLVKLWHEAMVKKGVPGDDEIEEAKARTGAQNIILDESNGTIGFSREGVRLDLGGVAQGYAADRAIDVLKAHRIENAIVDVSGDIYCLGRKSKKELWKIGIQHPRKRGELFLELRVKDKAVVTSGDYEQYFIIDGKRYSHIIDPRTGYPIGDKIAGATVIADSSEIADAFATALCVLGPDEGLDLIKSLRGIEAGIIYMEEGKLRLKASAGFEKYTDDHR